MAEYTMREVCLEVGMTYEGLKFYCKEGLIPNVKRDANNYRVFDERNLAWIKGLQCLRKCGMSIKEMRQYMEYCLVGKDSIPDRNVMLEETKKALNEKIREAEECLRYIEEKQQFYQDVLDGKIPYRSNLIDT